MIKTKGASFCSVSVNMLLIQDIPSATCGTHKWNGAPPSLMSSLSKIVREKVLEESKKENMALEIKALEMRIAEDKAWIKKYFNAASEFRGVLSERAKVRKAKILISRPIHAINHEEDDIAINEPSIRIVRNIEVHGRIRIKRRNYSIFGIWAQKLCLAYSLYLGVLAQEVLIF